MSRVRLITHTLAAVLAITAITAAAASAEVEFLPTPTAEIPLKFTATNEGNAILEASNGSMLACTGGSASGSFTSATLGEADLVFKGCTTEGGTIKCTGANNPIKDAAGTVLAPKTLVHLVDILPGSVLEPAVMYLLDKDVELECSILKIKILGDGICKTSGFPATGGEIEKGKVECKKEAGTKGEQEIKTCHFPTALCLDKEGKLIVFSPLISFGGAEELFSLEGNGNLTVTERKSKEKWKIDY